MASNDPSNRNTLRAWLIGTCHNAAGEWDVKAIQLAQKVGVPVQIIDLRTFLISGEETKPDDLVDQIIGEAEAACDGSGGGQMHFLLKAFVDGERNIRATRPFMVTLVQTHIADPTEATAQGVLAMVLRHNQQLQTTNLQMASALSGGLPRIMEAQAELIHTMQMTQVDNFRLMRQNIEDRDAREAEMMLKMQKAKDWSELKTMLAPALIEYLGPVVMKLAQNFVTPPEPEPAPQLATPAALAVPSNGISVNTNPDSVGALASYQSSGKKN
jgi:hypothetical protein